MLEPEEIIIIVVLSFYIGLPILLVLFIAWYFIYSSIKKCCSSEVVEDEQTLEYAYYPNLEMSYDEIKQENDDLKTHDSQNDENELSHNNENTINPYQLPYPLLNEIDLPHGLYCI